MKKRWVLVTCTKFYKLLCCWSIDCWVPICHSKMFLFNFKLILDQFKAIFWKNCIMQSRAICKFMQYANSRNMQIYAICKVLHYAKSCIMQSLELCKVWYYTKSGIMPSLVLCKVWFYAKSSIILSHNMQSPFKRVFSKSEQLMAIYLDLIKKIDPFVCNGPRLWVVSFIFNKNIMKYYIFYYPFFLLYLTSNQ